MLGFVCIYFKSHNIESFTVENAIEVGRSDSMKYFGPTTTATTFLRVSSSVSMEVLSLLTS